MIYTKRNQAQGQKYLIINKYHKSDKNLLEDERAKNAALEESYEQLLKQVQNLQNTHLQDLRNSEQRFHSASSALQKALISKAEELVLVSNKLASSEARYERDSREWAKERVNIMSQLETLASKEAEQYHKISDRERKLTELNKLRKELADRVASREQDLIKYGKALREIEGDYNHEKEKRMSLELKAMKLEQESEKRNLDFQDLQISYQRKQAEAEELSAVKISWNEAKRNIDDLNRRERQYLGEIEMLSTRERKLFSQIDELSAQDRKNQQDIIKLNEKVNQLTLENHQLIEQGKKMGNEIEDLIKLKSTQEQEIVKLEKLLKQYQVDSTRVLGEFSSIQNASHEARLQNQNLQKDILLLKDDIGLLRKENENYSSKFTSMTRELQLKNVELENAQQLIQDLNLRIDSELENQNTISAKNKEKYSLVSAKITELQSTLAETQQQLSELKNNELVIRNNLKQKEDALKTQSQSLLDAEQRIQQLMATIAKDQMEFENYKAKKRDELLAVQDKYAQAKQAMDAEVNQFRYQLSQKQSQLLHLSDDGTTLKQEISDLNSLKITLEAKIVDLMQNESVQQRQISTLQAALSQKHLEANRIAAKQNSLVDQIKRLEEELALYRDNASTTRDSDIHRLQTNMDEISKRLKNQVDVLLEPDIESHSRSNSKDGRDLPRSRAGSRSSTTSPLKNSKYTASATQNSPLLIPGGKPRLISPPNEEEDALEKLFKTALGTKTTP
jgi:chromosome segregation ATPase